MIGKEGKRIFDLHSFGPLCPKEYTYTLRTHFLILGCHFLISLHKLFLFIPFIAFVLRFFGETFPVCLSIFHIFCLSAVSVLHGP